MTASESQECAPIIVVGAGPVGLFQVLSLHLRGFNCVVIEKRHTPISDTRSLGIHPPCLDMLDELGLLNQFLKKGIRVDKGIAHNGRKKLGEINFSSTQEFGQKHPYILIHPQYETERILKNAVSVLSSHSIRYGFEVTDFQDNGNHLVVYSDEISQSPDTQVSESQEDKSPILIACDGKDSALRSMAGIAYTGSPYPDTYAMGDFSDLEYAQSPPYVYITSEGLVESFPIAEQKRRWVIKTEHYQSNPQPHWLTESIYARVGVRPDISSCSMISSFGVQHHRAAVRQKNRFFLVGDAAHVISPIGGQGMNLGWLGAWQLALDLKKLQNEDKLYNSSKNPLPPTSYSTNFDAVITEVTRRAHWNMKMGRKSKLQWLKQLLIQFILQVPSTAKRLAVRFSMSDLPTK
tara:strand:+ start:9252 stop:10469 length:1218 start_codon:yes stop_codon:yes gene_type:complete